MLLNLFLLKHLYILAPNVLPMVLQLCKQVSLKKKKTEVVANTVVFNLLRTYFCEAGTAQ